MIGEFSFDIDSIVSIYCTALIHTCNDEIIRFWDKPRTKKDLRRVTTEGKCNFTKTHNYLCNKTVSYICCPWEDNFFDSATVLSLVEKPELQFSF
mgnify:CR=1 FL=1